MRCEGGGPHPPSNRRPRRNQLGKRRSAALLQAAARTECAAHNRARTVAKRRAREWFSGRPPRYVLRVGSTHRVAQSVATARPARLVHAQPASTARALPGGGRDWRTESTRHTEGGERKLFVPGAHYLLMTTKSGVQLDSRLQSVCGWPYPSKISGSTATRSRLEDETYLQTRS
jgi:hypothetical protein